MNLVQRARNIIMQPRSEWAVISGETHTVAGLYTQYVMILAAIGPVASFIGYSIVGFGGYRIPIGAGIAYMVMSYALSLGAVYVLAMVINGLAPTFGGQKDFMQAFKVAAFAPTASWLAAIFGILPALAILGLLGLWSLYLLYTGLPALMRSSSEKAIPYTVLVIIAGIVLAVVIAGVSALVIPAPMRGF